jgi:hypothetical protein
MSVSKRDAAQLVADIRRVNVGSQARASRMPLDASSAAMAGFLGGLESVLQHFLFLQGCPEAAKALRAAMNDVATEAEIAASNAASARLLAPRSTSHG